MVPTWKSLRRRNLQIHPLPHQVDQVSGAQNKFPTVPWILVTNYKITSGWKNKRTWDVSSRLVADSNLATLMRFGSGTNGFRRRQALHPLPIVVLKCLESSLVRFYDWWQRGTSHPTLFQQKGILLTTSSIQKSQTEHWIHPSGRLGTCSPAEWPVTGATLKTIWFRNPRIKPKVGWFFNIG